MIRRIRFCLSNRPAVVSGVHIASTPHLSQHLHQYQSMDNLNLVFNQMIDEPGQWWYSGIVNGGIVTNRVNGGKLEFLNQMIDEPSQW